MLISNGGMVASGNGYVYGSVLVTGTGSLWSNSDSLHVSLYHSNSSMVISNGGMVFSGSAKIGGVGSSSNTVLVTGSNSLWSNSQSLIVGDYGSGHSMVISNGGMVSAGVTALGSTIGRSSNNSVLVTGSNSFLNTMGLDVGSSGSGNSMVISNGAMVSAGVTALGSAIGRFGYSSNNSVLVTGEGSRWSNATSLYVGNSGSGNSLSISNGGTVFSEVGWIGFGSSDNWLGFGSSNNTVLVTGTGSLWSNSLDLHVGGEFSSGNNMVISNGGMVFSGSAQIGDWESSSNTVLVTGTGSLWSNSGSLAVGVWDDDSGHSMVISNGGMVFSGSAEIGNFGSSSNTVLVTGTGSTWSNSGSISIGVSGGGEITVAHGASVMAASGITIAVDTNATGALNIGRYGTNDSAGAINASTITFGKGTGSINFNQSNSVTISSTLSGAGAINQLGSGTTILTGDNTYSGTTTISAGTFQVGNGGASGTIGGGDVVNNASLVFNWSVNYVGDFSNAISGSGSLTVMGGTLNMTASNSYTGLTKVSSGTLAVNGSIAGNLQVDAGATLKGSGTIAGDATISGTHSPGNSPTVQQSFRQRMNYEG
jgi:hypothetical protein